MAEEEAKVAEAEELSGKLDDVDTKIEEVTTSRRHVRQDVPTTCDEIADLVDSMELAETTTDRLKFANLILQTTITKCTTSDKLLKVPFISNNINES